MSTKRSLLLVVALAAAVVLWRHAGVSNILLTSTGGADGQIRDDTPALEPRALALMGLGLVILACACAWWRSRATRHASKR